MTKKKDPVPLKLANLKLEQKLYDDAVEYARQRDETFSRFVRRLLREEVYAAPKN
jgi:hypothetical protein